MTDVVIRRGDLMLFFILPSLIHDGIYILAAILPAIFLLRYIWKMDRRDKEPPRLLSGLIIMGIVAALVSIVLEKIGSGILDALVDKGSPLYTVALAFLVVAVVEEGTKFFFLKKRTWNDPNFDYRFDGIVYAVFVSLGFAAFENVKYVSGFGLSVALPRALLAVPGHMGFAVFMGVYYGRAKMCEHLGELRGRNKNLRRSYIVAVLLHGFYDACAMYGNVLSTIIFSAFIVIMYMVVIGTVKKESVNDRPI